MHDICHPTILVPYAKPLVRNDVDIPPLALSHGGRITGLLNLVKLDPSKGETPDSVAQPTFLVIFKRGAFNLLLHGEAPEFSVRQCITNGLRGLNQLTYLSSAHLLDVPSFPPLPSWRVNRVETGGVTHRPFLQKYGVVELPSMTESSAPLIIRTSFRVEASIPALFLAPSYIIRRVVLKWVNSERSVPCSSGTTSHAGSLPGRTSLVSSCPGTGSLSGKRLEIPFSGVSYTSVSNPPSFETLTLILEGPAPVCATALRARSDMARSPASPLRTSTAASQSQCVAALSMRSRW